MDKFVAGHKEQAPMTGERITTLEPVSVVAGYKPISDYGVIGNSFTGALVARDGSIDWCCLPRFDSPSTFAAILDTKKGGCFAIRPSSAYKSAQRYIFNTNILVTTFRTEDGSGEAEIIDFFPMLADKPQGERTEIHRVVCGVRGQMELDVILQPRFDYARIAPKIEERVNGPVAYSPTQQLALSAPALDFTVRDDTATARLSVRGGDLRPVVLIFGEAEPQGITDYHSLEKLNQTQHYWRDWVSRCQYNGGWRDHVMRSALLMKLMQYSENGTMIRALTTSLPLGKGNSENHDYRLAWIRDAALVLEAMMNAGWPMDEVEHFVLSLKSGWDQHAGSLSVVRGLNSELIPQERELSNLEGYRRTGPIHIGSEAARKLYLAPYGEVLRCWAVYRQRTGSIPPDVQQLVEPLADFIVRHWQQPDHGRTNDTDEPRQYIYSKVMCAVGLDAAMALADSIELRGDIQRWKDARESIFKVVMEKGWSDRLRSFTRYFGGDELDASALVFPLYGFIPFEHPKMISTVEQIVQNLGKSVVLRRFGRKSVARGENGSGFPSCSFWLGQYYIGAGQAHEAEQIFARMIDLGNHVSLYSEAIDPKTHQFLGNFPDALVHASLINLASGLSDGRLISLP
ncbi:MAG: glycoside hydrolase family 15 protein [Chloroflexi bacterium]|nr:glycoside hydrolase family 15 protein [Chloroflexota bacterium]